MMPPTRAARRPRLAAAAGLLAAGCQGYPLELRAPERAAAERLVQQVATLAPTDVLFVVDNSGSMLDERRELARNVGAFVGAMARSGADFQVGIVTTDVDCNVPERNCGHAAQNYLDGTAALGCCQLAGASAGADAAPPCAAAANLGDAATPRWVSSCDGGRLRGPAAVAGGLPFWRPPTADAVAAWTDSFAAVLTAAPPLGIGCQGSGLESGLEAARRAVTCSAAGYDPAHPEACPAPDIAALNAGFVRPGADLVVIFVTDEDDCSFRDAATYRRPADPNSVAEQAAHLCSPQECYAGYGRAADRDGDGRQDWDDTYFACTPADHSQRFMRLVDPPLPDDVGGFLTALVAAKGGDVRRVRAAAVLGGQQLGIGPDGFAARGCTGIGGLGVSTQCSCWSASALHQGDDFYCALTQAVNGRGAPASPAQAQANECSSVGSGGATPQPGCNAMPGTRYADFLVALAQARAAAAAPSTTLAASICDASYAATMLDIVNTVILSGCFALHSVPADVDHLRVLHNGQPLAAQTPGSGVTGFSWVPGSREVCLEGAAQKQLGDVFEVTVLVSDTAAAHP